MSRRKSDNHYHNSLRVVFRLEDSDKPCHPSHTIRKCGTWFYDFASVSLKPLLRISWTRNFRLYRKIDQIWHIGNIAHYLYGWLTLMLFLLLPQEVQGGFVKRANSTLTGRGSL